MEAYANVIDCFFASVIIWLCLCIGVRDSKGVKYVPVVAPTTW